MATEYKGPACSVCNTGTRPKFAPPRGGTKNSRRQHSRWWVCEKGHQLVRKG